MVTPREHLDWALECIRRELERNTGTLALIPGFGKPTILSLEQTIIKKTMFLVQ